METRKLNRMAIVVCDCRDAVSVLDYLLRYPDMRETVNQIVRVAREHLPDAQLELLVYTDPEIDDSYLVLYARFPEYTPEVMERIRAARRACLPFTRGKSEWILLTTDFRRVPRTTQLSS